MMKIIRRIFSNEIEHPLLRLGKDTLLYGGTSAIAACLGLVIIILTTRLITPAQYGAVELYRMINQFFGMVIVMGMDSAQSYFFYQTDERKSLHGSLLQFRLICGLLSMLVGMAVIPFMVNLWGGAESVSYEGMFWVLIWCWASQSMLIPLTLLRVSLKPIHFGFFSVAHTLLAVCLAVAGMVFLPDPVMGYLAGFALASLFLLLVMLIYLKREFIFWPLQAQWWGKLFKFGSPFLYSAPLHFGLQTVDRWFVLRWLDQSELGIYAVGVQFAMIIGGLTAVFITAWEPLAMSKLEQDDGPYFFRSVARFYLGGFTILAVCLTLVLPLVVHWSVDDAYFRSSLVARILIWKPIMDGFFYLAIGGIWKHQKTIWVPALMGCAFIMSIFANGLLVPRFGILGAAFSSTFAFLILGFSALHLSERLWRIHYPIKIFAQQLAIGMLLAALIVFLEVSHVSFVLRLIAVLPGLALILFITWSGNVTVSTPTNKTVK